MRNNPPGSIRKTTRKVIEAHGGLLRASDDLGMSYQNLSKASGNEKDRPGGLGVKYLNTLGRINPASAEPVAEHFARLAGGMYVPPPSNGPICSDIHKLTKEFSDVLHAHAEAHSERSADPHGYTPQEARRTAQETLELMQAAAALFSALQAKFQQ